MNNLSRKSNTEYENPYFILRKILPDDLVMIIVEYKDREESRLIANKSEIKELIEDLISKNKISNKHKLLDFDISKFLDLFDNKYRNPDSSTVRSVIVSTILPNLKTLLENLKYLLNNYSILHEAYNASYNVVDNNESIQDRLLIGPREFNLKIKKINEILKVFYKYGLTLNYSYFMELNSNITSLNSLIKSNRVLKKITEKYGTYLESRDKVYLHKIDSFKSTSERLQSNISSRSKTRTLSSRSRRSSRRSSRTRKANSI
uniref:Uncharacterized protein n=1 Tax=Nucleocytoviricota sp. TaxID=2809609 RepID=A0A9E8JYN6_9VIRU|nr:hypothetical protein [Nucleocytoviricota sp.]UZT29069.1 hypothetical protein [Nucleocytoviricota sp.]